MVPTVRVAAADFDPGREAELLGAAGPDIGAVATFVGLCRREGGRLSALELEHYPGMAEAELGRVATEAAARFPLLALTVIHRHGLVRPGERIVFVGAAAAHRSAAFGAVDMVMDFLKTRAPFWKREHGADGQAGAWVESKGADDEAASRWNRTGG